MDAEKDIAARKKRATRIIQMSGIVGLVVFIAALAQILQWFGYPTVQSFLQTVFISIKTATSTKPPTSTYTQSELDKEYAKLSNLMVNVQISYVNNILGNPIIDNVSEQNGMHELMYRNDLYLVQIISDKYNKVLAYAVTTRKEYFSPEFSIEFFAREYIPVIDVEDIQPIPTLNQPIPTIKELDGMYVAEYRPLVIKLGRNRLAGMDGWQPHSCYGYIEDDFYLPYYFEAYDFGAANRDLYYLVGINDAGYLSGNYDGHYAMVGKKNSILDCANVPKNARQRIINTFIVSKISPDEFPSTFGVDWIQMIDNET